MKAKPIRDLRITTLADNLVFAGGLGQWGLSLLLEFIDARGRERKLIFDTSRNKEALMYNIKHLELDVSDVASVVLSHGHLDHTAATVELAEAASGLKVFGHPHTFLSRFYEDNKGKRRQIGHPKGEGIEEIEKAGGEVILTAKPLEVLPGVWTTGQIGRTTSFEFVTATRKRTLSNGGRLIIIVNGEEIDDLILDDQAIWMDVKGVGPFVITGCAHSGLVNTLLHIQKIGEFKQLYGMIGGTHLFGRSKEYLNQTIRAINQIGLNLISPCHCTGIKASTRLWQAFPESFVLNFCCRVLEAGKKPEHRVI